MKNVDRDIDCIDPNLRRFVDSYKDVQDLRRALESRLSLSEEEMEADKHIVALRELAKSCRKTEGKLSYRLSKEVPKSKIGLWLLSVKGVSHKLAAQLMSEFNPYRAKHASSFWRFAGAVPGQRYEKGKSADFSKRAKVLRRLVSESFLKSKNQRYRAMYDEYKERYLERGFTKGHAHNAALRIIGKDFLRRFWIVWRTIEGLPTDNAYVVDVEGHTDDGRDD